MTLAQCVTTPGGERSLILLDHSEYANNAALFQSMLRHKDMFVPDAVYTLVPETLKFRVNSATGNVEEVK